MSLQRKKSLFSADTLSQLFASALNLISV